MVAGQRGAGGPYPSWPCSPSPHVSSRPEAVTRSVCAPPHVTCWMNLAGRSGSLTLAGVNCWCAKMGASGCRPVPPLPWSALPQVHSDRAVGGFAVLAPSNRHCPVRRHHCGTLPRAAARTPPKLIALRVAQHELDAEFVVRKKENNFNLEISESTASSKFAMLDICCRGKGESRCVRCCCVRAWTPGARLLQRTPEPATRAERARRPPPRAAQTTRALLAFCTGHAGVP